MSPIAMRPSTLGPVKRKFELDDNYSNSYSPPPFKKIFTDRYDCHTYVLHLEKSHTSTKQNPALLSFKYSSRGHSPCRSPLLGSCPSPDSTEGRTTPKFYVSKLCTANTNSSSSQSSSLSAAPSPNSSGMESPMDIMPTLCAKVITQSSHCGSSELNSDLDSSDVDFDSDTAQHKGIMAAAIVAPKRNTLTKYLARVSTDSNETDCSIDFKAHQLNNDLLNTNLIHANLMDNKSELSMDCDTAKALPNTFSMVQNLVSSTDDIQRTMYDGSAPTVKTDDFMDKCVAASSMCVSVVDVTDANVCMVETATAAADLA